MHEGCILWWRGLPKVCGAAMLVPCLSWRLCIDLEVPIRPAAAAQGSSMCFIFTSISSECVRMQLYTSGSTGKPKGVEHTLGGYMVGASTTFKYVFDHRAGDIYWCTADCGWITGHSYVTYGESQGLNPRTLCSPSGFLRSRNGCATKQGGPDKTPHPPKVIFIHPACARCSCQVIQYIVMCGAGVFTWAVARVRRAHGERSHTGVV